MSPKALTITPPILIITLGLLGDIVYRIITIGRHYSIT